MMPTIIRLLLALLLLLPISYAQARPPLILAAASLQESLTAAAEAWRARGHPRPILSFAATPVLARQIAAGAPADLFLSADEAWMDTLSRQALIRSASRSAFLSNRLVLIAPAASRLRLSISPGFPLVRALGTGRLAVADPRSVPAGRYARAALTTLGVWRQVSDRIAPADSVRAALILVERGEVPAGIVYATDARASRKVRVIGLFPAASHPPIRYSLATLRNATSPDAEPFRRFLLSSAGRAIFTRYGFGTLPPR